MDLQPGRQATVAHTVVDADTATALGSGDVDVLGTPRVVGLAEQAAVAAVADALPPEQTSVGAAVHLEHLAPCPVGATVNASAVLVAVDGRRLMFRVEVREGERTVARGSHERAVVERSAFD